MVGTRGSTDDITALATWGVPCGIIGARIYHVVTDFELYQHDLIRMFYVWDGGLGIWGGIAGGVAAGAIVGRKRGLSIPALMDMVAPALALAQAIGRWGNYFNQELFRPSHYPSVGTQDRPGSPSAQLRAIRDLPAHVPLRIDLGSPRVRHLAFGRPEVLTQVRAPLFALCRPVHIRPLLHRTPENRLCPHLLRAATERLDKRRCFSDLNRAACLVDTQAKAS